MHSQILIEWLNWNEFLISFELEVLSSFAHTQRKTRAVNLITQNRMNVKTKFFSQLISEKMLPQQKWNNDDDLYCNFRYCGRIEFEINWEIFFFTFMRFCVIRFTALIFSVYTVNLQWIVAEMSWTLLERESWTMLF